MKWPKKLAIVLICLIALVFLANIGLNWWIEKQLPQIVNRENDTPYQISYDDASVSLIGRSITAKGIVVVPKSSLDIKANKPGLYANVEKITVNGVNVWDLVFSNKIVAKTLIIDKPDVTLLKTDDRALKNAKSLSSAVVKPFSKVIFVSDVFLNHGNVRITQIENNRPILKAHNISLSLEGILVTDETLEKTLPFTFEKYDINCDSAYYRASAFYYLTGRNLKTDNRSLVLEDFKFVPLHSRKAFIAAIPREKDQYAIVAAKLSVNNMKWGFEKDKIFFHSQSIVIDKANANIYRGKMAPDDPKKKRLYSELLRNIKFPMKVDTLKLRNSKLVYEEELDFEKGPGVLTFSQFNMRVTGIQSGFNQTKMPDVKIRVDCRFMETARFSTDWTFNVLDQSEKFNIRGRIFDFPAERLIPFTKPYVNAEIKGDLDEVYFNFTGNDNGSKGDFAINYDDLKVKIFKKKDPKKKNKLLTSLANLFVKNDTKDKVTSAEIEVERKKDRSFFNLLWISLAEGLKKILI